MIILYVAMKYDYGDSRRGLSFEHYNFFDSLRRMGHDLLYFDFLTLEARHGREGMNRRLREVALAEKPALLFSVLHEDQLSWETLRDISAAGHGQTLNWFCDDHWRFSSFSRHWAPAFNWVVTTDSSACEKYAQAGYHNAIHSQWACNHFLYRNLDLPLKYDVSFIGQPHSNRRQVVDALRSAGLRVHVWGHGWESGRLSQGEMIEVFNQSRVNLNLSNCSSPPQQTVSGPNWVRGAIRSAARRALASAPLGAATKRIAKRGLQWADDRRARHMAGTQKMATPVFDRTPFQIKARDFEVPGCGGCLLTGRADNLAEYFEPGQEVACYSTWEELLQWTRRLLADEVERRSLAAAGRRRVLKEHTYRHRFHEIFRRIGLADAAEGEGDVCREQHGCVTEIN